jgi:hypothetical protein
LRSAAELLRSDGLIAVSVVVNPHCVVAFAMTEAGRWAGLSEPTVHPFYLADYPGYHHAITQGNEVSAFQASDQLQTYVSEKLD